MTTITLSPVTDWVALGERWRELETRSDCSFFQSWTWTGCLAEERFSDPVLLQATREGRPVAMGLFSRRRDWTGREVLWLGESGSAGRDAVFIEWNGLLAETGTSAALLAGCMTAARTAPIAGRRPRRRRRLVLSGIDEAGLEVAQLVGGGLFVPRSMAAPFVDLAALRQAGRAYLAALSANSRYQIRRSDRLYRAAHATPRHLARRGVWLSRRTGVAPSGHPGARVAGQVPSRTPISPGSHQALIGRGFDRGEIALLRFVSGDQTVRISLQFRMAWVGLGLPERLRLPRGRAAPEARADLPPPGDRGRLGALGLVVPRFPGRRRSI